MREVNIRQKHMICNSNVKVNDVQGEDFGWKTGGFLDGEDDM